MRLPDIRERLVLVHWLDSHAVKGWKSIPEIVHRDGSVLCVSIGYVVNETKESITLVATVSFDDDGAIDGGCDAISIPRVAIKRKKVLQFAR